MPTIKPFDNAGGYTTFDNAVIDHVMPKCKPNTWKVVCATIRKTIGWNKESDSISLTQYMKLTGIKNRTTLLEALNDALELGFITRVPYRNTFAYQINKGYELEI